MSYPAADYRQKAHTNCSAHLLSDRCLAFPHGGLVTNQGCLDTSRRGHGLGQGGLGLCQGRLGLSQGGLRWGQRRLGALGSGGSRTQKPGSPGNLWWAQRRSAQQQVLVEVLPVRYHTGATVAVIILFCSAAQSSLITHEAGVCHVSQDSTQSIKSCKADPDMLRQVNYVIQQAAARRSCITAAGERCDVIGPA